MEYNNDFAHVEDAADNFRRIMVAKLRAKQYKGNRPSWRSLDTTMLLGLLLKEHDELKDALIGGDPEAVADEAADVANFAMMVADTYAANSHRHTRMDEPSELAALRERAEKAEVEAREERLVAEEWRSRLEKLAIKIASFLTVYHDLSTCQDDIDDAEDGLREVYAAAGLPVLTDEARRAMEGGA